nr:hypothetical protein [Tanacetum cinerariifolium]
MKGRRKKDKNKEGVKVVHSNASNHILTISKHAEVSSIQDSLVVGTVVVDSQYSPILGTDAQKETNTVNANVCRTFEQLTTDPKCVDVENAIVGIEGQQLEVNIEAVMPIRADKGVDVEQITNDPKSNPIMIDKELTRVMCRSVNDQVTSGIFELHDTSTVDHVARNVTKWMGNGDVLHTARVEYEWNPPRCGVHMVFGHNVVTCPKRVVDDSRKQNVKLNDNFQNAPRKAFLASRNNAIKVWKSSKKADEDKESDIKDMYNETRTFMAPKQKKSRSGFGNKSLHERWKIMDSQYPTLAKIPVLDTGKFEQWQFRIQQYLQLEHYALWEVIEFGDSYKVHANADPADSRTGRTITTTTEDMQKKKNDVKARTTLLLSLPDEHQLRFSKYKTARELWAAILKTFGGYNAVPPPTADLYLSPKKDLSWTGLPEFVDDTVTDYSRPSPTVASTSSEDQNKDTSTSEEVASTNPSKPFVKFVKPKDSQPESKLKEQETSRKPQVKYFEQNRQSNKRPKGNQRNWNNLKSYQLGPEFVLHKKPCFNCGDFSHLAKD